MKNWEHSTFNIQRPTPKGRRSNAFLELDFEPEIRNSNPRNPKEIRSPKSEMNFRPRWRSMRETAYKHPCSGFGFQASFGFRISEFGLPKRPVRASGQEVLS